jgi:hypothetical protein
MVTELSHDVIGFVICLYIKNSYSIIFVQNSMAKEKICKN